MALPAPDRARDRWRRQRVSGNNPGLRDPLSVLGRSGLLHLGGRVYDEWDLKLQGFRGRRALREMSDQSPIAGAFLYALEMLIRQVHWNVEAGGGAPEALVWAQFVDECLDDMEETWPDTLAEILTMLIYGFSYHELIYKLRAGEQEDPRFHSKHKDGKIGWRAWEVRSQEALDRWEFDSEGRLLGMWQIPPPDYRIRFIPIEKAMLFRPGVRRGNPEGRSLLRSSYRNYYLMKQIETIESIGIERDLVGFPVMYVPPEIASPETKEDQEASDEYLKALTNIKRDEQEGLLLPSVFDEHGHRLYELLLLTSGGHRSFDTNAIITRHMTAIAQSVLADFLMVGHSQRGATALAQSKVDLFNTSMAALIDSICAVINAKAIPKLCRMNGYMGPYPVLTHGEVERVDLMALGQFMINLSKSGADIDLTRNSPVLAYLLEEAGLPIIDGSEINADEPDTIQPQVKQRNPKTPKLDQDGPKDLPPVAGQNLSDFQPNDGQVRTRSRPAAGRPEPGNPVLEASPPPPAAPAPPVKPGKGGQYTSRRRRRRA